MNKYFVAGIVMMAASGSAAIFLNMLGASCLTQLARIDRSLTTESVEELERNCFIITNSYECIDIVKINYPDLAYREGQHVYSSDSLASNPFTISVL